MANNKEYMRKYREENHDRLAEYSKKYRELHREKIKENRKKRKEKEYLQQKEYRSRPEVKEKNREYNKKYHEKHKNDPDYVAKRSAYHAEWQRKNKERVNEYQRERRKKKYVIKMSNAYGNTAIHSVVDTKKQAEAEVLRLIKSQERYDNHYWWEEQE